MEDARIPSSGEFLGDMCQGDTFMELRLQRGRSASWTTRIRGTERGTGKQVDLLVAWSSYRAAAGSEDSGGYSVEAYRVRVECVWELPTLSRFYCWTSDVSSGLRSPLRRYGGLHDTFQVLMDHRARKVRFGPVGNLGMVSRKSCGIGSYGLGKVIRWAKERCPDYGVVPVRTSDADAKDPQNPPRRDAMYARAGLFRPGLVRDLVPTDGQFPSRSTSVKEVDPEDLARIIGKMAEFAQRARRFSRMEASARRDRDVAWKEAAGLRKLLHWTAAIAVAAVAAATVAPPGWTEAVLSAVRFRW